MSKSFVFVVYHVLKKNNFFYLKFNFFNDFNINMSKIKKKILF